MGLIKVNLAFFIIFELFGRLFKDFWTDFHILNVSSLFSLFWRENASGPYGLIRPHPKNAKIWIRTATKKIGFGISPENLL